MKDIKLKIIHVFLPFVIVTLATIIGYSALRWLFDFKLGLIPLKEDILNMWIPIFLPWVPILYVMNKRLQILDIRQIEKDKTFGYQMIMWFSIMVPLIVSQMYIEVAAFDLNEVHSPTEIQYLDNEKYFKINQFQIEKQNCSNYFHTRITGKHSDNMNFYSYFACPFEGTEPILFYAEKYWKTIDNDLSQTEKNKAYNEFIQKSQSDFNQSNFQEVVYFEKEGYTDDWDGFVAAIQKNHPTLDVKNQIILQPKNESFDYRVEGWLKWIGIWLGLGFTILFAAITYAPIYPKGLQAFKENKYLYEKDSIDFYDLIKLTGNNTMAFLLVCNCIVFLFMVLSGVNAAYPTTKEIFKFGGITKATLMDGEYWRLLSSMFVHGGIGHLISNLFMLFFAGLFLEPVIKSFKFITIYLLTGIISAIGSIYWYPEAVSVGASGAISGLFGVLFIFHLFKIYADGFSGFSGVLLLTFIFINSISGLFMNNVSHVAHLTGFLSGCLIGLLLYIFQEKNLKRAAQTFDY